MDTVSNGTKRSKRKIAIIALATAICITVPCVVGVAYAYYVNNQLTQSNEISVGQTVETVVLEGGSLSSTAELYPGDSVDVTYTLDIENTTSSATVTTALTTTAEGTNFDEKYFTVTYKVGDDTTVYTNDNPCTVTTANNGQDVVVTVKMNDSGDYYYTYSNMPTFSEITLTVTLNEVTVATTTVASFVDDYKTSELANWSYGYMSAISDYDYATKSANTFTAAEYDSDAWKANEGNVTIGADGAISGAAAVTYTFSDIDDNTSVNVNVSYNLTSTANARVVMFDADGDRVDSCYFISATETYNDTFTYTVSSGYTLYVVFDSGAAGTLGITITK